MKIIKYISLIGKITTIEGQRESVIGQHYLSTKLYRRGDLNEKELIDSNQRYESAIKTLNQKKWEALKNYAKAA